MKEEISTQSPLSKAKGLGASKEGTHHWWHQRITAVALVPLTLWFISSLIALGGAEREIVINWFGQPLYAIIFLSTVLLALYHAVLGLQVVIEDYIHSEWLRHTTLWGVRLVGIFLGSCFIMAVMMMMFFEIMRVN